MTLSSLGGLLGIVAGVVLSWFVDKFFGFRTIFAPWAAVLAFAVSLVVGLIFGKLEHLPRGWQRSKKDSANAYYVADASVVIIFKHADRDQFGIVSKCFATDVAAFEPSPTSGMPCAAPVS